MNAMLREKKVDVSFVMPCLNEAATIGDCVDVAQEAIRRLKTDYDLTGEIIIADNGSDDGSQDIALNRGARVVDVDERGYGAALRGGFAAATGDYLVMGDSDMSYDFREAVPMIGKLMGGADLCMGSRFKGEIKPGAMPWKNRYIGNPVLSAILRILFQTRISDSHCGLRAIRREAYDRLGLTSTGMEFASEMVLKSSIMDLKLAEVPVTLSPDGRGRAPHLNPWRDGFRHLFYMFMLAPNWLFMAPSALLAAFSLPMILLLLASPDGTMVTLGRFGFGDHWMVVASAGLIVSVQLFICGMATYTLGMREGYLRPRKWARSFLKRSTLSGWLKAGLVLCLSGAAGVGMIAAGWASQGFGALSEMRSLIAAFSLIIVGLQVGIGGFLMAIVAGNKMKQHAMFTEYTPSRNAA